MKLLEKLDRKPTDDSNSPRELVKGVGDDEMLLQLRESLHKIFIDKFDLRRDENAEAAKTRSGLRPHVEQIIRQIPQATSLQPGQQAWLIDSLLDELTGLGPLEPLLHDPAISDIMVNSPTQTFIERGGKLEVAPIRFNDTKHLVSIIQRIVSQVGRRVDESSPLVDARLPDGSRVNAVVPPIALDGAILSIRRFGKRALGPRDLLERKVLTEPMMVYLTAAVKAKCNLVVSGGTGSGKTTMLNILSGLIPDHERVITIEDAAELSLQGSHVVRMEARPPNNEGRGEVSIRACVRNALRMRPDRVVIGEVRGAEVLDMLQAMNTGHEGSMATIHANTPRDAVDRLIMMLALGGVGLNRDTMAQFISRSVHAVVQVARFPDGARRCTGIAEVGEYNGREVEVREIFVYSPLKKAFIYKGGSQLGERFAEHGVPINLGEVTP